MTDVTDAAGTTDAALAAELAVAAGRLVVRLRSSYGEVTDRATASALRDEGDRGAHDLIVARLGAERPGDAVLSEEGRDDERRLGADRLWIVDPLDGTWEYGLGRDDFAVHVALWQRTDDGGVLTDGAVSLPAQGTVHRSDVPTRRDPGLPVDRPVRLVVSRTRAPSDLDLLVERVAAGLGREVEVGSVGSAGAKAAEVIEGRYDAYVHDAGLSEWDVAAPAVVAAASGLVVRHLDGSPIAFNRMPPLVGDLVIGVPAVVDAVLAARA